MTFVRFCLTSAQLKDYALGEHLLLVGNQGVGKNKIADQFLHLLHTPREYIQLHRDTTVREEGEPGFFFGRQSLI